MIRNLVRNTDCIEFDFLKEDRVIHFKISGNQSDAITEGGGDTFIAQYTSEQYLIAANQIAYLDGDIDPEFTARHPSETFDQVMAREPIDLNPKYLEDDYVENEFVVF